MRRALAAVLAAAALVLAGCGDSDEPSAGSTSTPTGTAPAATTTQPAEGLPTVAGAFGSKPTITLPGDTPGPFSVTVLSEGDGPVVKAGDQLTVNYLGQTWRDGNVFDESFGRGEPVTFPIGVGQLIPGWDEGLVGLKVGSRVLLVLPPDKGYGTGGNPQAGIQGDDTLVFVVDIVDAAAG
jgi:peptidylprolyl isomerase